MNFKLDYFSGGYHLRSESFNYFVYSGGEVSIKIPESPFDAQEPQKIVITTKLHNSDDIMALLMLNDALLEKYPNTGNVELRIGYIPYARQDRVCAEGEAFSSRVFGTLINSCEFTKVSVIDPHSNVCVKHIDYVEVITSQLDVIKHCPILHFLLCNKTVTLVSPDAGASSKTELIAKYYGYSRFIQAQKHRDTNTGELSGFSYDGDVKGKNLLIIDDICDGGGTFIGLAKELIKGGANSISLYVTHGIFSKGIDILLKNGISKIYTTDTFDNIPEHQQIYITKIN